MNFLTKFGQLVLKGAAIVTGLSDLVTAKGVGGGAPLQIASKDLAQIALIVMSVEAAIQAGHLTTDQALAVEAAQAKQIILSSAILLGKPIADPTLIDAGTIDIVNGLAKILKGIHPDAVKEVSPQDALAHS